MLYGHGDDIYAYGDSIIANFSSNVWHGGAHQKVISYLQQKLDKINNYPHPEAAPLKEALASYLRQSSVNMVVCNGATEAIYLLAQAWQNTSVTIFTPTFSEYEDASNLYNLKCSFVDYSNICEGIKLQTDIAFICNPNNPTGTLLSKTTLVAIIKANPDTTFIIDEAYSDFTVATQSLTDHISILKNLVVLKSLTKIFAIPGIRIGYIVAPENIATTLMDYKIPWSVNALAEQVGVYIMSHYHHLKPCMRQCLEETLWLREQIDSLARFQAFSTATSYFLVKTLEGDACELKHYLATQWGVLVRDASNFRGLDDKFLRVATQDRSQNEIFIKALKSWKA